MVLYMREKKTHLYLDGEERRLLLQIVEIKYYQV